MTTKRLTKVRELTGRDMGIVQPDASSVTDDKPIFSPSVARIYKNVQLALQDGFSGVILVGPPGTGKSLSALEIAHDIAGAKERVVNMQFHPSYQYEDFVEGFVPDGHGNFKMRPKTLLQLCEAAGKDPDQQYVLLIDEISRSDVTRVFGEAMTYLEPSKRGQEFRLQSGTKASIPANIIVIATMNPWDRGVDELDWAIERRFAKIEVPPDSEVLSTYCIERSYPDDVREGLLRFFKFLQDHQNSQCKIGHAYFMNSSTYDPEALKRLWDFQLSHHLRKAFGRDTAEFERVHVVWKQQVEQVLNRPPTVADASTAGGSPA